jgi:urease accessory protein
VTAADVVVRRDTRRDRSPVTPLAEDRSGRGRLAVIRRPARSVVSRAFARSPLRLLTPANHGHAAWVYTSSYGGGLVDGDTIDVHATVGAGACAFVSTQASTKVYRSPRGTRVTLHAEVDDDGLLVVAPDPVVCFARSRYHQAQRFDLAERAGLVLLDWISSGRRESGERWAFDEYVSRTTVRHTDRRLVHEALSLRASDGDLATRLGDYDVLAVAVIVGTPLAGDARRILTRVEHETTARPPGQLVAAAPVGDAGCVLRVAGRSVEDVGSTLLDFLDFVPARLGDNPWARKW